MSHQTSLQWRLTLLAAVATAMTSLSLLPTMAGRDWLVRTVLCIAAIAVTGGTARQLNLPRPLVPVAQAIVLVIFLALTFGGGAEPFDILRVSNVWTHWRRLLRDGLTVTWDQAPPVTVTPGIGFLVVGGVGVVALAVDNLAVTWRRSLVAGLPLFVLYLVPAAVLPDGVPWPLFALAGLGWVMLLLAEGRDRLSRWGKLIGAGAESSGEVHAVGGTGRRLGASALVAAIVIPLVLPSLDGSFLGSGSGSDTGTGLSQEIHGVITPNPIVDLRRNLVQGADTVVIRYQTTDPTPSYLRTATLSQFNGTTWTLHPMEATQSQQVAVGLPNPPGLQDDVARTPVTSNFHVLGLNSRRLPLPYPVTQVQISGDWRWDADTFDVFAASITNNAQDASYTANSLDVEPTAEQLRAAPAPGVEMAPYLTLPDGVRSFLQNRTDQVVSGQPTKYDEALALQNWFREKFTYSLKVTSGNDTSALAAFLADRSGYCEQFAATMALMARVAGIPSRVQVGFTPGSQLPDGTWEVSTHDAHAWPELWFAGIGWVRFEPTPGGGDGGSAPGWAPLPASSSPSDKGGTSRGGSHGPLKLHRGNLPGALPDGGQLPGQQRAGSGGLGPSPQRSDGPLPRDWAPYLMLVLLVSALAASAPKAGQLLERRHRWKAATDEFGAIEAAWSDVLDAATDVDLAPKPTETSRDLARRLPQQGGLLRETGDQLGRLALALERARYAAHSGVGSPEARDLTDHAERIEAWRQTARQITTALLAALPARDRRRARWWPASGRAVVISRWSAASASGERLWGTVTNRLNRGLRRA